jgi:hypothetical protein
MPCVGRVIRVLSNNLLGVCPVSSGYVQAYARFIWDMRPFLCDTRLMETTSTLDGSAVAGQMPSDATHKASSGAPKRDRTRTLTKVDRRSVLGKRVVELVQVFTVACDGPWTALRKLKVRTAAENVAVAELARGRLMRGEGGELSDVITAERRAAAACRAIGISTF